MTQVCRARRAAMPRRCRPGSSRHRRQQQGAGGRLGGTDGHGGGGYQHRPALISRPMRLASSARHAAASAMQPPASHQARTVSQQPRPHDGPGGIPERRARRGPPAERRRRLGAAMPRPQGGPVPGPPPPGRARRGSIRMSGRRVGERHGAARRRPRPVAGTGVARRRRQHGHARPWTSAGGRPVASASAGRAVRRGGAAGRPARPARPAGASAPAIGPLRQHRRAARPAPAISATASPGRAPPAARFNSHPDPLGRKPRQPRHAGADRGQRRRVRRAAAVARLEAEEAQRPQIVLGQPGRRVADEAHPPGRQVRPRRRNNPTAAPSASSTWR